MTMSSLWIDVKNELPCNNEEILVFTDNKNNDTSFEFAQYNITQKRFEYTCNDYYGCEIQNVTHWQWLKAPKCKHKGVNNND